MHSSQPFDMKKLTVIHERFPYRYVEWGLLENGKPDIVYKSTKKLLRDTETCIYLITVFN